MILAVDAAATSKEMKLLGHHRATQPKLEIIAVTQVDIPRADVGNHFAPHDASRGGHEIASDQALIEVRQLVHIRAPNAENQIGLISRIKALE